MSYPENEFPTKGVIQNMFGREYPFILEHISRQNGGCVPDMDSNQGGILI